MQALPGRSQSFEERRQKVKWREEREIESEAEGVWE